MVGLLFNTIFLKKKILYRKNKSPGSKEGVLRRTIHCFFDGFEGRGSLDERLMLSECAKVFTHPHRGLPLVPR